VSPCWFFQALECYLAIDLKHNLNSIMGPSVDGSVVNLVIRVRIKATVKVGSNYIGHQQSSPLESAEGGAYDIVKRKP
jgi:hypothetical protein